MKRRKTVDRANRSNSSSSQPSQQRPTANEIIAANVKSLIAQLEAGHSEALTAYLNAMNRERLLEFIALQGIELAFDEKIVPALGMSYGGRIAILPGQSQPEEFATLVHELAHEMLHRKQRRATTNKIIRETETEAVAFVVGKAVHLQMGSAAADYIQLYKGDASVLAESLEVIQQTSAVILAALRLPDSDSAAVPDTELAEVV